MKRILTCVLALGLIAAAFGGCAEQTESSSTDENSAVISKDDSVLTELSVFDEQTDLLDTVEEKLENGVYTIKGMLKSMTMGLATESPIEISVKDDSNYYYSVTTVSSTQNYIVKDGKPYIINSEDGTYASSTEKTAENIKKTIDGYIPSKENLKYKDSYMVRYNNEKYLRERYTNGDDQTVSFFFLDNELKIIGYDNKVMEMNIESYMTINEFTLLSSEDYFSVLNRYQKVTEKELLDKMSSTTTSNAHILDLLDSMGITDSDLAKMGYTKADILKMDENQLSLFFAGLYGEDISQ